MTLNEFINYYTNVGSAIDNDDYFDLLVRNVWGLETTGRGLYKNPVKSALRNMLTDPVPVKQPQRPLSAAAQQVQKRWSAVPGQNNYQSKDIQTLQQQQQQQQQLLQQQQQQLLQQHKQPSFQPPPYSSLLRPSSAAPTTRPQSAGAVKRPIIRSNPQGRHNPLSINSYTPPSSLSCSIRSLTRNKPQSTAQKTNLWHIVGGPISAPVERIPPAGLAFMLQQMKSTLKSRGRPYFILTLYHLLHITHIFFIIHDVASTILIPIAMATTNIYRSNM